MSAFRSKQPVDALTSRFQSVTVYCAGERVRNPRDVCSSGLLSSHNLPIGMQFCAGFNQENLLLALADQLKSTYPWQTRKQEVWAGR
jgi:amidase